MLNVAWEAGLSVNSYNVGAVSSMIVHAVYFHLKQFQSVLDARK